MGDHARTWAWIAWGLTGAMIGAFWIYFLTDWIGQCR